MWIWIAVILLYTASYPSNGAKILGVLMTESKSRYSNIRNVADELASRGHEVCKHGCLAVLLVKLILIIIYRYYTFR